jgi:uncharacterized protein YydD (DUF2326 family)
MINRVFANQRTFKDVIFSKGFNVIWADRTKESTKKDSRNGLGKSTLIEIIHFCFGSKAPRNKGLAVEPLSGWEFSLELEIGQKQIIVTRCVDAPGDVLVEGDVSDWPIRPKRLSGSSKYSIKEWNALLGYHYFGLSIDGEDKKYEPSFRSLIPFFIRRQKDAFSTPFEHHRKQKEWDKQINNAYLLGLAWEDATELQELKDRKKGLADFKKAAKAGIVRGFVGTLGDLDARKVRLKLQVDKESSHLQSFKVHPQYEQIQTDANRLTEEIHAAVDINTTDKRLLSLYEKNLVEEQPPALDTIENIYKEAAVDLPGVTLRRLDDVRKFHATILDNRRVFLLSEMERLKREIIKHNEYIRSKTEERAYIMEVLRSHGALDEYTILQKKHMDTVNQLNSVSTMIDNLKAFETGLSEVKIAREVLQQQARRDYDERNIVRERAITLFNAYSENLYSAPGKLLIDVGPTGFKFDIEIERSGSTGISNMKVFCYDLMLATLWANRKPSPRLLVHDSTIFDGVDERQRALALELAAHESEQNNFQYICMLNSDYVPWAEFSSGFDLNKYIKLRLTDENITGCLLGVHF